MNILKNIQKIALLIWMILGIFKVSAQVGENPFEEKISRLMKQKPIRLSEHPQAEDPLVLYFPMYFSSSQFLPETKFELPKDQEILSVHLVYTRYRQVDTFDQPLLNEKRFLHLSQKFPDLFKNENIEWRIFEQTKGKTEEEARIMYHGFVIFLKEKPKMESNRSEMTIIDDLLMGIKDTLIEVPEQYSYRIRKKYVETGRYLPNREDKIKKGIRYNSSGIWFREPEMKLVSDSVKRKKNRAYKTYKGVYTGANTSSYNLDVYNQLRNKTFNKRWGFVIDVTGSMAPYTGQVLALLKTRPELATEEHFSFFNDGNGAPEILKRIGNSGGVYTVKSNHFDSIYQTMERAMRAGSGGDLPENNIEAILRTLKQWPGTDSILMVADAHAPVKDLKIIGFVNKPVLIVLCGDISNLIPLDYVQIAKQTFGGILTNEGEIRNLHLLKMGQTLELGNSDYQLTMKGLERR